MFNFYRLRFFNGFFRLLDRLGLGLMLLRLHHLFRLPEISRFIIAHHRRNFRLLRHLGLRFRFRLGLGFNFGFGLGLFNRRLRLGRLGLLQRCRRAIAQRFVIARNRTQIHKCYRIRLFRLGRFKTVPRQSNYAGV